MPDWESMTMKLFALLSMICAVSSINNVCHAQLTEGQETYQKIKAIPNSEVRRILYSQLEGKAISTGVSLFGKDERIPATLNEQVGTLWNKSANAFEIGDWGCSPRIFEVLNVVSESEVLILDLAKDSKPMLIRGLNTDKVTDGVQFVLRRPFIIDGTYQYETVGGSLKTVLVLDTIKVEKRMKEVEAAAELARATAEEALSRTWTIGDEEFVAKYAGYTKGIVTLIRKDNGSTVEVKVSALGKLDQRWVVAEIKRAKEKNATLGNAPE